MLDVLGAVVLYVLITLYSPQGTSDIRWRILIIALVATFIQFFLKALLPGLPWAVVIVAVTAVPVTIALIAWCGITRPTAIRIGALYAVIWAPIFLALVLLTSWRAGRDPTQEIGNPVVENTTEIELPSASEDEVTTLRKTLGFLDMDNPRDDLARNISAGDRRFIGINGDVCTTPGVTQADRPLLDKYGVNCLNGTSSSVGGFEFLTLQSAATQYAATYNDALLRQLWSESLTATRDQ